MTEPGSALASAPSPAPVAAPAISPAAQQRAFHDLLGAGRWEDLEKAWLEWLERGPYDAGVARSVIDGLANRGHDSRAATLCLCLVPRLQGTGRHADALEFCRCILKLSPEERDLRSLFLISYRASQAERTDLEDLLCISGLEGVKPLPTATADLDALLEHSVGDFFFHENGWGLGRIVKIEAESMTLIADFSERPNHRIPLRSIRAHFRRLASDDFRVLLTSDPPRLAALAMNDPVALLNKIMEAHGEGVSLKEIKATLVPTVLKSDEWSGFWSRLKKALKQCPTIEVGSGASPRFHRREAPRTPVEGLTIRLAHQRVLAHRLEVLEEGLREFKGATPPVIGMEEVIAAIIPADRGPKNCPEALGVACALAAIRPLVEGDLPVWPTVDELLTASGPDAKSLVLNAGPTAYQKDGLAALQRTAGAGWPALATLIFYDAGDDLRDAIAEALRTAGHAEAFAALVQEIAAHPRIHTDAAIWLVRAARADDSVRALSGREALGLCELLLQSIDRLGEVLLDGKDLVLKAQLQKGRSLFAARNFAEVRAAIKAASDDALHTFWGHIRFNRGISDQAKDVLRVLIAERIPDVVGVRKQQSAPVWIYCTAAGLERRRKELEKLVNVDMAENSKAIGKAMELGDLSENSEFSSAIEQQTLLARKGEEMKAEIDRARIIDPSTIPEGVVAIGTRVVVQNLDAGHPETYSILGPWDGSAEEGIISYSTPLAQALLEKKVGNIVEFAFDRTRTRYEVKEIHKAV